MAVEYCGNTYELGHDIGMLLLQGGLGFLEGLLIGSFGLDDDGLLCLDGGGGNGGHSD